MTNEEISSLTDKLSDIKPVDEKTQVQRLQGIWPWKKGLVSDAHLASAFSVIFAVGLVVIGSSLAVHFAPLEVTIVMILAWLAIWLLFQAISGDGLIQFFCPARRALKALNWARCRREIRYFNRDLAELQANENQLVVGIDPVEYQKIFDKTLSRRGDRYSEVDRIVGQLVQAKKDWERKRSKLIVQGVLGDLTTRECLEEDKK
jgi:hypothetical protein